ncbi:ankyrin repeat domain-containing protein 34A [Struthio camelus]|uniref:ankyrin repeat domain-containing protein 34A n=1 Tax=Struthio camelus TaxID=8801 RepID=UPI003603CC6B
MPSPPRRPAGPAVLPADGSALLRAVTQGKFRLTRLLLEGGAYINEGNAAGQTPLMAACRARYADPLAQPRMVRYLLERGADPDIADKTGKTALMHACAERAGPAVAAALLAHGADPSARDYAGASALVYALNRGDRETLQALLDACRARGKEVIIITTATSPRGTKTTRQYLNAPPSPAPCASPSDVEVRAAPSPAADGEEERDVFRFPPPAAAPPPARARGRPLKRLNSEPWGLAAPEQRLAAGLEALSVGPRRRHSVEGREAAGLAAQPAAPWAEPTGGSRPVTTEPEGRLRLETSEVGRVPPAAGDAVASPPPGRRRSPGLLERRGSGTFLLEPAGHSRAGFLPPLLTGPHPPGGVESRVGAPASSPARRGSPKGRRKLLRRHSMQTEQMRQLATFQSALAQGQPGS